MRTRTIGWTWLAALVALLASTAVRADEKTEALGHYKKGTTLFDLQRYPEAATEFQAAYEARSDPAFLFNIGQAMRLSGDAENALGAYRGYLKKMPNAANRKSVESLIVDLEKAVAEKKEKEQKQKEARELKEKEEREQKEREAEAARIAAAAAAPPPVVVVTPPANPTPEVPTVSPAEQRARGRKMMITGYSVAAAGLVVAAAGVAFTVLAYQAYNELNAPSSGYVFISSTESNMKLFQPLGGALLAVGAAALVGGVTFAIIGSRRVKEARVAFAPSVGPGSAGGALSFEF